MPEVVVVVPPGFTVGKDVLVLVRFREVALPYQVVSQV